MDYYQNPAKIKLTSKRNPELVIYSRYDVLSEKIELSNFVFLLDKLCLSEFLKEVAYDSKANIATYEFKPMPEPLDFHIKMQTDEAANLTLSQYEDSWGTGMHGVVMTY